MLNLNFFKIRVPLKPGPLQPVRVSGSGVPPYDFLNLYGDLACRLFPSVSQKRLELR
jgi:hypothetical protein